MNLPAATGSYVNTLGLRANATPLVAPKDMAKHVASLRYKAAPAPAPAPTAAR